MIPLAALKLLPWRHIAGAVAVVAVVGSIWMHGRSAGKDAVQARWDADKAQAALDHAAALGRVLEAQKGILNAVEQARRERRNEEDRIRGIHAAIVDSLRDRPEGRATSGVPDASSAGTGCTGAGLARPDAGFLAGYAADAARLQSALAECRAGYQAARERIDEVNDPSR